MSSNLINKKICLLGKFGVGKTSLIQRFVYDRFDDVYLSTIGVKVTQKILPPIQNPSHGLTQFNFLIWDIDGLDEASLTQKKYFMGAAGALVISDLTRKETIQFLPKAIDDFLNVSPEAKIVIVGNKEDLITGDKELNKNKALEIVAKKLKLPFMLASAKTGKHVEACFFQLGNLLIE